VEEGHAASCHAFRIQYECSQKSTLLKNPAWVSDGADVIPMKPHLPSMNLPSLSPMVVAAVLGLSGNIMAQTPEITPPPVTPTRAPGTWANAPSDEDLQELGTFLNLGQGTMAKAAESLRNEYFEKFAKTGLGDYQMPKLIYGPGAKEAEIEGELKLSLYNMRAVDAVTLIAAAAGCRLEPIPAPPESPEDKKKPQRVVGYYVTIAMRNPTVHAPGIKPVFRDVSLNTAGTIGLTLAEQNGDILIRDVVPGLPAAQSKAIVPGEKLLSIAEEGATEVRAAEVGQERVSELLVGDPGSKVRVTVAPPHGEGQPKVVLLTRQPAHPIMATPPPLVRVVEPVVDTFSFINTAALPNPAIPGMAPAATTLSNVTELAMTATPAIPSMPAGPLVRIYPVAFIIKGDETQMAEKQVALEELMLMSLDQADLGGQQPTLSLHRGTKVLIVKATPAQHEIIQQIITSLKENEQAEAQGTGTLPR
jgi:hypothetical protein